MNISLQNVDNVSAVLRLKKLIIRKKLKKH
jgi:hypothetical protein